MIKPKITKEKSITRPTSFPSGIPTKKPLLKARLLAPLRALLCIFLFPFISNAATYVGGDIRQNATWRLADSPIIVTSDVTVRHSSYSEDGRYFVTLTIEAGVTVLFNPGTGLAIGKPYYSNDPSNDWGYYGALSVQGTAESPVIFSSNEIHPAPGDWKGLNFVDHAKDAESIVNHAVIEYGGDVLSVNLRLYRSTPTIQNSVFSG